MSNLGSCLLATLPAWLSFLHLWLEAILLHRLVPTAHHITTPSEIRVHKKKKSLKNILENISLLAASAVDTITFSFSASPRVHVCVCLSPQPISQADDLNGRLGLFVHSQPAKPSSIVRSISSRSRLHCFHILGDQMSVLPFITWAARVLIVNTLITLLLAPRKCNNNG